LQKILEEHIERKESLGHDFVEVLNMLVFRYVSLFCVYLERAHKQTVVVSYFHDIHNKVGLAQFSIFDDVVQSLSVFELNTPRVEVVHDIEFELVVFERVYRVLYESAAQHSSEECLSVFVQRVSFAHHNF
jgi:hypothetical protein